MNARKNSKVIGRKEEYFHKRYDLRYGNYSAMHKNAIIRYHHKTAMNLLASTTQDYDTDVVLDIGCAAGDFTGQLKNKFVTAKVIGMDFVQKGIDLARHRYDTIYLIKGKLPSIPLKFSSVNVCCCMEILYYLDKKTLNDSLEEIDRVLANDGLVIASTTLDDGKNYFTKEDFIKIFLPRFQLIAFAYEPLKLAGSVNWIAKKTRQMLLRFPYFARLKIKVCYLCERIENSDSIVQFCAKAGQFLLGKKAISKGAFIFKRSYKI